MNHSFNINIVRLALLLTNLFLSVFADNADTSTLNNDGNNKLETFLIFTVDHSFKNNEVNFSSLSFLFVILFSELD